MCTHRGGMSDHTQACLDMAVPFLASKGLKVAYSMTRGSNLAGNRNESVRNAKQSGADYMFFLDDDMTFAPDDIYKLWLNKADIVGGLYVKKLFPHTPNAAIYDETRKTFDAVHTFPPQGILKVDGIGTGFMMIKMKVFDKVPDPWFCFVAHGLFEDYRKVFDSVRLALGRLANGDEVDDVRARMAEMINSVTPPDKNRGKIMGEDYYFCRRAKEHGFQIGVDCGVRVGHVGDYSYTINEFYVAKQMSDAGKNGSDADRASTPADA